MDFTLLSLCKEDLKQFKMDCNFYINCCGSSAVEFFNPHQVDSVLFGKMDAFHFEKIMK